MVDLDSSASASAFAITNFVFDCLWLFGLSSLAFLDVKSRKIFYSLFSREIALLPLGNNLRAFVSLDQFVLSDMLPTFPAASFQFRLSYFCILQYNLPDLPN
jgi:hypothetical protein